VKAYGVIPARGGSKGVPRKNIRPLAGRPLLVHSIEAARAAPSLTRVVVSSDDPDILAVAAAYGASALTRPPELATDAATTDSVLVHVVQTLALADDDLVVLLQPTVPIRRAGLIEECIQCAAAGWDTVLTAYPLHFVWWDEGTRWVSQCTRRPLRQHMAGREIMYEEDGAVFVCRAGQLRRTGRRVAGRVEIVKTERSVDIDTPEDFLVAEALLSAVVAVPA
jgi:CMP-N-acetylneuraminic acid synthetase